MATYAIGDIQGCFKTLKRLLERIGYQAGTDRLWLVGDLVNRGPRSLQVLRWARDQGESVVAVLGNHDLHLLAVAEGKRRLKRRDTLTDLLAAKDSAKLLDWLAARPLIHREQGWVLVHAGVPPFWTIDQACERAAQVERRLRSNRSRALGRLYKGVSPRRDSDEHRNGERLRLTVGALTRMRACTPEGALDLEFAGSLAQMPDGLRPWFEVPCPPREEQIVFGHWAALGHHQGPGCVSLDTGCVWGGALTAYRLDDGQVYAEPNQD